MILFETVSKQFGPESFGLDDISFEIDPGELVFITGKSGSGKTTLMRLLTREYLPSSGEISFEGVPLSQIPDKQVHTHRRKIGVVFQDYRLLPELTAWENVALPLSIIGLTPPEIAERVADLLRLVKLEDKARLFPSQLSGGEAQRVSIARALAIGPKVLFADEPTGNLDWETSLEIAQLLEKINQLGTTLMFATHDQRLIDAFGAHRSLQLENGKLVKDTKSKKSSAKTSKPETAADSMPEPEPTSSTKTAKKPIWHQLKLPTLPTIKLKTKPKKSKSKKKEKDGD